jgi:hypothetical protein
MSKPDQFETENTFSSGHDENAGTLAAIDQGIRDAKAGRTVSIEQVREMLDSRYDDVKSGRVAPIASEQALVQLRRKSENRCGS